jgi:hypothetical protein
MAKDPARNAGSVSTSHHVDVIVIVGMVTFFAMAAGYVKLCEKIVGDQSAVSQSEPGDRG